MKQKATAANQQVDLLAIQDSFEKLGRDMPSWNGRDAILKLGRAHGLTGPDGRPKSKTAQNFLKLCLKAFRRGQRTAKKAQSRPVKSSRKSTSLKKTGA
jgi:hypothetical protein